MFDIKLITNMKRLLLHGWKILFILQMGDGRKIRNRVHKNEYILE